MVSGIILLDKPKGITSREACEEVKKIINAKKAGNSGTLDPNASGLLLICTGESTKIMPALQGLEKEYIATIHFHNGISRNDLENLSKRFTGKVTQVPPVRSAVARRERQRIVFSIEIHEIKGKDAILLIRCEAGTYIRKLADDMGKEAGGAHLKDIRRTAVGKFRIEEAHSMEEIRKTEHDKIVLPVEKGVEHMEKLVLKDISINKAALGKPLSKSDFTDFRKGIKKGELIALMSSSKNLVALARYGNKILVDRVIMEK